MASEIKPLSRRDFLKGSGCVALGIAAGLPALAEDAPLKAESPKPMSRVVLIRDAEATDAKGRPVAETLETMLDRGMTALFDEKDRAACFSKIISPEDVVGIKSNEWGPLPTPAALEEALTVRVIEAGVSKDDVAVSDRGVLGHPVFRRATALINIRPMRTHAWSGVGSLIKNYIMFTPEPWAYHDNACAPLGAVWQLPECRDRTRLNILVMLTPLFHGVGPHHFDPTYIWRYNGLLLSTDPVACDTMGLRIIQEKRREYFGKNRPLQPVAHHIALADKRYGLGTSDLDKIELVRLGWERDALI